MPLIKKIKLNKKEMDEMCEEFDNYLWAAVYTNRGVITTGDDHLLNLRDFLLEKHSKPEDIICAGVDLKTGELFYPPIINRSNPCVDKNGIPEHFRNRTETLIRYFFDAATAFQEEHKRPRYSKKPTPFSFS
jgi:hypothetical protein